MILLPAALALAIWGGVMAVSGFRQGNKLKIFSGAGAFALLASAKQKEQSPLAGPSSLVRPFLQGPPFDRQNALQEQTVMMEFITRPL